MIGDAALAAGAGLRLELVDEVDDVEKATAGAAADAGPSDGDGCVIVYRERKRFFALCGAAVDPAPRADVWGHGVAFGDDCLGLRDLDRPAVEVAEAIGFAGARTRKMRLTRRLATAQRACLW